MNTIRDIINTKDKPKYNNPFNNINGDPFIKDKEGWKPLTENEIAKLIKENKINLST